MNHFRRLLIAGLSAFAVVWIGWRLLSRRFVVPCPPWMWRVMENPYIRLVAGSGAIIERLNVRPGMTVLDVGAGSGRITLAAATVVGTHGQVIALDVQPEMLKKIRERAAALGLSNIRYLPAEISSATLDDDAIDRATMVIMLGEIPERERALRTVYRALKPGGILSITESLPDPQYQTRRTVRRLTAAAGFELIDGFGNFWSFTINVRKPEDSAPGRSDQD